MVAGARASRGTQPLAAEWAAKNPVVRMIAPRTTVGSQSGMVTASPSPIVTIAPHSTGGRPTRSASLPATTDAAVPDRYARKTRETMLLGRSNGGPSSRNVISLYVATKPPMRRHGTPYNATSLGLRTWSTASCTTARGSPAGRWLSGVGRLIQKITNEIVHIRPIAAWATRQSNASYSPALTRRPPIPPSEFPATYRPIALPTARGWTSAPTCPMATPTTAATATPSRARNATRTPNVGASALATMSRVSAQKPTRIVTARPYASATMLIGTTASASAPVPAETVRLD